MINLGMKQDKNPFEWNLTNNYMQLNQGKKHFWGMGGKDYGLIESSENKRRKGKYYPPIESLQNSHLTLSRVPVKTEQHSPQKYQQRDDLNKSRIQATIQRQRFIQHQQTFNRNPHKGYFRTLPIQNLNPEKTPGQEKRTSKKHHLSLQSNNINLTNHMTPVSKRQVSPSLHHQFSVEIRPQARPKNTINYDQRSRNDSFKKSEIDDYRQRIVRIIRKDRKNNPTFCNSLAYPLYCHRYVQ